MTGVMPKPKEPTITVTLRLTPEPVETVLGQVTGAFDSGLPVGRQG